MNEFKESSSLKRISLLAILGVISTFPYITWYLFGQYYVIISTFISVCLLGLTCLYYSKNNIKISFDVWMQILAFFWLSIFVHTFFVIFQNSSIYDFRHLLGFTFKIIMILSIALLLKLRSVYTYVLSIFFKLNVIIVILSILLFFILLSGFEIEPIRFLKIDNRYHSFYWIGATNVVLKYDTTYIRIAGFADEPGALALILTYLIVINEITFKSKLYRIVLTIGGLFTFSVAFIITLVPLIIYWIVKSILSIKYIVIFSILFLTAFTIIGNRYPELSKVVENLVIDRLEKSEEGTIKGDNRSWAIPLQLEAFEKYPLFGTGINPELVKKYELSQPNFYSFLGTWGIYGYLLFYIPYLFLIYKFFLRKEIILLLALGINFLQRPGIEDTFILFCLTLIYYSPRFNYATIDNHNYCSIQRREAN